MSDKEEDSRMDEAVLRHRLDVGLEAGSVVACEDALRAGAPRFWVNADTFATAAAAGRLELMAWLAGVMGLGVDVEDSKGETPLMAAAAAGSVAATRWLLQAGASPRGPTFHSACATGCPGVMVLLVRASVEAGVHMATPDAKGRTPAALLGANHHLVAALVCVAAGACRGADFMEGHSLLASHDKVQWGKALRLAAAHPAKTRLWAAGRRFLRVPPALELSTTRTSRTAVAAMRTMAEAPPSDRFYLLSTASHLAQGSRPAPDAGAVARLLHQWHTSCTRVHRRRKYKFPRRIAMLQDISLML